MNGANQSGECARCCGAGPRAGGTVCSDCYTLDDLNMTSARAVRAERQVAAVRDELSTLPALADAFRSMGDTTAGTAIEQVCRDIRRALETE